MLSPMAGQQIQKNRITPDEGFSQEQTKEIPE
jgi:hypothetical protein